MSNDLLAPRDNLPALAQVANGVAPALNDLLMVIAGRANLLLDSTALDAPARESVHQIYTSAERAVSLIRQLMLFSGAQKPRLTSLDLNQAIAAMTPTVHRILPPGVSATLTLTPEQPVVSADPAMLEQALLSLVLNGIDALPRGGSLHIATDLVAITPADLPAHPDGRPGSFAVLRVVDDGIGIAPEVLPRIFEPFFTTKHAGRSAGLGLAALHGMVQLHHGWVEVGNHGEQGTEFQIYLPAVTTGSARVEPNASGPSQETILLVEDDDNVREFTRLVLQSAGYRVLQTRTVAAALETWRWHGPRIRLLLTDLVLDDAMSGWELAWQLRTEQSQLRVICISGHSPDHIEKDAQPIPGCVFLQKPCRPQTLLQAVRNLLDAP